jgi:plasmid rolling circle replication initiator protein Rep
VNGGKGSDNFKSLPICMNKQHWNFYQKVELIPLSTVSIIRQKG